MYVWGVGKGIGQERTTFAFFSSSLWPGGNTEQEIKQNALFPLLGMICTLYIAQSTIDTSVMLKQYYFSNFQFSLFYFGFHYFTSHIYNIHIHYMSRFSPWQWKVLIYLACGECSRWSLVSLCLLPALTNHSLLQQRFFSCLYTVLKIVGRFP